MKSARRSSPAVAGVIFALALAGLFPRHISACDYVVSSVGLVDISGCPAPPGSCPTSCLSGSCQTTTYNIVGASSYSCLASDCGSRGCYKSCPAGTTRSLSRSNHWSCCDDYTVTCYRPCQRYSGLCSKCESNKKLRGDKASCDACPAGQKCDGTATSSACAPGTASPSGASSCKACPAGHVAASAGLGSCSVCGEGFYATAGGTQCAKCEAGFQCSGGMRTPCAAGFWSGEGARSCSACPAGHKCNNGRKEQCAGLTYQPFGEQSACLQCSALTCGAGQYRVGCAGNGNVDAGTCLACTAETQCGEGSYLVNKCTTTDRTEDARCETCRTCPAGSFLQGCERDSPGECTTCEGEAKCGALQFLSRRCDGTTRFDSTECSACAACEGNTWVQGCTDASEDGAPGVNGTCAACTSEEQCAALGTATDAFKLLQRCDGTGRANDTNVCVHAGKCNFDFFYDANQAKCRPCAHTPATCGAESFLESRCTGADEEDTSKCSACARCGFGQFSDCGGESAGSCRECNQCADGERMVAECRWNNGKTGKKKKNFFVGSHPGCEACSADCPAGFFLEGCDRLGSSQGTCSRCQYTSCPSGQFLSQACPGGPVREDSSRCSDCVSCGAGEYNTGCMGEKDSVCKKCDGTCGPGEFILPCDGTGRENNADKCRSCGAAAAECAKDGKHHLVGCGSQEANHTATNPGECVSTTTCLEGYYEAVAPTDTSNRECERCATCDDATEFQSSFCTATAPGSCDPLTVCGADEFEFARPTATSDRECRPVTKCEDFEFLVSPAGPTNDAVCRNITVCDWDNYFQSVAPVPGKRDGECQLFKNCLGQSGYIRVPGNRTTDHVCGELTECTQVQFVFQDASPTSDRVCQSCVDYQRSEFGNLTSDLAFEKSCVDCDARTHYETQAPSRDQARVCEQRTVCTNAQFEVSPGNATTDRTCRELTMCEEGEFEAVLPLPAADRVCEPCSSDGESALADSLSGEARSAYDANYAIMCKEEGFWAKAADKVGLSETNFTVSVGSAVGLLLVAGAFLFLNRRRAWLRNKRHMERKMSKTMGDLDEMKGLEMNYNPILLNEHDKMQASKLQEKDDQVKNLRNQLKLYKKKDYEAQGSSFRNAQESRPTRNKRDFAPTKVRGEDEDSRSARASTIEVVGAEPDVPPPLPPMEP